MQPLPIDFLDKTAVHDIVTQPLSTTPVLVPSETTSRVYEHTGGYPETVQQMAEIMLRRASEEKRVTLTPADADEAAVDLATFNDNFADTWYPVRELSKDQLSLMAAFVNAVPLGGRIELHKLAVGNKITDALKAAVDDLVGRKILEVDTQGTYGVRAYVLDLWLRKSLPRLVSEGTGLGVHGSVAIFVDVANLTSGTGSTTLTGLNTASGEGIVGRFSLKTILERINGYARKLSPAPVAERWVANYPPKSPAVVACNEQDYWVVNIPQDLFEKGSDDVVLRDKISDVEQRSSTINHFVIVTGDKDFRLTAERLCKHGNFIHIVGRAAALSKPDTASAYDYLARQYPQRFTVMRLEELLDNPALTAEA